MNCLTCQALPRTQSDRENHGYETSSSRGKSCCLYVPRRWSAELTPPTYESIKIDDDISSSPHKKVKTRRVHSDCSGNEPRLVRSSGMRRDWSFEDLGLRDQKKGRFHWGSIFVHSPPPPCHDLFCFSLSLIYMFVIFLCFLSFTVNWSWIIMFKFEVGNEIFFIHDMINSAHLQSLKIYIGGVNDIR